MEARAGAGLGRLTAKPLPERLEAWWRRGLDSDFRGHRIHALHRGGTDPLLLFLHGFPSSSYDWRQLIAEQPNEQAVLAFDCLGFGLSDKPRDHDYSLVWQADLAEELVQRHAPAHPVLIVAHDMGTSIATELMARDIDGRLQMELAGVLLLNGSMVQGAASPTVGQRLLRSRLGPLFSGLATERFFRAQFASIFSPEHPLTDEEAADQWQLICHGGGQRLGHKLIGYMNERERRAQRWHGALRRWNGPLEIAWGMLDPVATPKVLQAVRELRPKAPLTEWEDLGHYPQIEDPERVDAVLRAVIGRL
jgi:pimeloyl-ACP methyl ester carboxylesterase